ncbi:hypothetical protein AY600_02005 [Phormidium willei BDU 130791]|nr:hypothetical protein AY600_02005 [Phormidium willei BDU 130791]
MSTLLYFLLWLLVIFLLIRFGCGAHRLRQSYPQAWRDGGAAEAAGERGDMRWIAPPRDRDPVCGQTVRPERARSNVYDGQVRYFCSRECRERFEAAPHLYLAPEAPLPPASLERSHG